MTRAKHLVSTDWLRDNLDNPEVIILDGSLAMPGHTPFKGLGSHSRRIPGAIPFAIDVVCDHQSPLPHMLPSPEDFAAMVGAMGIGNDKRIVVYDDVGIYSAPRVWWMFRAMGVDQVAVLDGGLPRWQRQGQPLCTNPPSPTPAAFIPVFKSELVYGLDNMLAALNSKSALIIDARSRERFAGDVPEPRAGLRCGHIPGSYNVPFTTLLNEKQELHDNDTLATIFAANGIEDLSQNIVTTCGSGVTAATVSLALAVMGYDRIGLYDGSWSEWGSQPDLPVALGC